MDGGSNHRQPECRGSASRGGRMDALCGAVREIPVTLRFPEGPGHSGCLEGGHEWHGPRTSRPSPPTSTPSRGRGRRPRTPTASWSTAGAARTGSRFPTHVESAPFRVEQWDSITGRGSSFRTGWARPAPRSARAELTVGSGGPAIQAELGPIDYPDSSPLQPGSSTTPGRRSATRRRPRTRHGSSGTAWRARSGPGPDTAAPTTRGSPWCRGTARRSGCGPVARRSVHREPSPQARGTRLRGGRRPHRRLRKRERTAVVRAQGPRLRKPGQRFQEGLAFQAWAPSKNGTKSGFASGDSSRGRSQPSAAHPARRGVPSTSSMRHIDPALKDDVRLLVSEVVTNSVSNPRAAAVHRVRSPSTCGRPRKWCGWRSPTAGPDSWQPAPARRPGLGMGPDDGRPLGAPLGRRARRRHGGLVRVPAGKRRPAAYAGPAAVVTASADGV